MSREGCPGPLRWSKRWAKTHPFMVWFLTVMVILVVTVGSGAHYVRELGAESRARVAAFEQETINRNAAVCQTSVDIRTVIRALVTTSTGPSSSYLTSLPAYKRMPVAVQEWVSELQASLNSASGPNAERREELLRKVPIPDCGPPLSP